MSLIKKMAQHFAEYGRSPREIDDKTVSFEEKIENVSSNLVFTELSKDHILGYSPYLPPLEGSEKKLHEISKTLLNRNSRITGVSYSQTDDGTTIVKGDIHATQDDEETLRRVDDLWLDLREQLKNLPEDLDTIKKLGLKIKKEK